MEGVLEGLLLRFWRLGLWQWGAGQRRGGLYPWLRCWLLRPVSGFVDGFGWVYLLFVILHTFACLSSRISNR